MEEETRYFTFDTTHHALWAEELAREAAIPSELVPTPHGATARCNLALVTLPESVSVLGELLSARGVPFAFYPAPSD